MSVTTACELGAAPLDASFGLADDRVRTAKQALEVPEESIRREGAILDREVFDPVAARLRADYSWS